MEMKTVELAKGQCQEYPEGTPPVAADAVAGYMDALPGWSVEEGKVVHKAFRFNNFANALAFVNRIGDVAEEQDHHPDLELGWGRVVVNLSTHSVGGLSPNDFILAARVELLTPDAGGLRTQ